MADAKTPALTRGPRTPRPNRAGLQGCSVTQGCRVVMRLHICATLQRAPRGNASTLQRATRQRFHTATRATLQRAAAHNAPRTLPHTAPHIAPVLCTPPYPYRAPNPNPIPNPNPNP